MLKNDTIYDQAAEEKKELFGFDVIDMKLPFEVYDEDELQEWFIRRKLVPYAGTYIKSGHHLLDFYNDMGKYSPTSSSCIFSKKSVFFGNKMRIVSSEDELFDFEEANTEVPIAKKKKYAEFITTINYGRDKDFRSFQHALYEEFECNGNMAIEVEMFMVGTEKVINFKRLDTRHYLYKFTTGKDREVEISYKWEDEYQRRVPPRTVPVYPNASVTKGVFRTVIHESNGSFWYGRPPSKGSVLNQYNEYQNMYYLNRLAAKEFLAKTIIEVEDDAPSNNRLVNNKRDQQAGFKSTLDRFEKRFTNASKNPSTFMLMSRPTNSKPMAVHQIMANTNERFYEKMGNVNETKVIQSHAWSKRLLGGDGTSLFSTGVYMDELKVKDATTNIFYQRKLHSFVNTAIHLAMDWANVELKDVTYEYQSPYIEILKKEKYIYEEYGIMNPENDDDTNLVEQNQVRNATNDSK